ncbi:MAG TPA: Sec-independent protein translocase subunit TatA [Actinomycetales bacterium]|jgi:sec-independent protein translocase protein TatA
MNIFREPTHLLIVALVILVLFGGKKLPEAARGLGRSMRIFKAEVKEMREDDKPGAGTPSSGASTSATGPLEGRVMSTDEPVNPVRDGDTLRSRDEQRQGL